MRVKYNGSVVQVVSVERYETYIHSYLVVKLTDGKEITFLADNKSLTEFRLYKLNKEGFCDMSGTVFYDHRPKY